MPPSSISSPAVTRSATRILLLDQTALLHQLLVEPLVRLHPLRVLGAGREGGLERSLADVAFVLRGVRDLAEKADVPLHSLLGHVGWAENAPQHVVGDIGAKASLIVGIAFQSAAGVRPGSNNV